MIKNDTLNGVFFIGKCEMKCKIMPKHDFRSFTPFA